MRKFTGIALATLILGCGHTDTPQVAVPTPRQETVTVKVTKVEWTQRETNGTLWAEIRFIARDGSKRFRFFANCNQNVNEYHCGFFTPHVGQKYVIELHHEPGTNFCVITDDGSSTGLKLHTYVLETEELIPWWNRLTE
jgi:hypothetical protein